MTPHSTLCASKAISCCERRKRAVSTPFRLRNCPQRVARTDCPAASLGGQVRTRVAKRTRHGVAGGNVPAGPPVTRVREAFMVIRCALAATFSLAFSSPAPASDITLHNRQLSVKVREQDGSYQIAEDRDARPVLRSIVGAQIDHRWLKSSEYPKHEVSRSGFEDTLGRGRQITVTASGLAHEPDLVYVVRLYDAFPFGDIQVEVRNRTGKSVSVQSIRSVDAIG